MTDAVNPSHYTRLDPEPIDVIARWGLSFDLGNVVKYCVRAGHKPGVAAVDDLAKAKRYLEHAIDLARVEAGLAELVREAPEPAVMAWDMTDEPADGDA